MHYAISDIHGCYDSYQELLEKIHFGPDDTLYVLGDVLDRGPDGFKILTDIAARPNVICLLGNHEAMAIQALSGLLRAICSGSQKEKELTDSETEKVDLWFSNGGEESLNDFFHLDGTQMQIAWDYMKNLPLYRKVTVGERKFLLVHGGLSGFSPTRPLDDYTQNEIVWCRPKLDTSYYPDKITVLGHTPVQLLCNDLGKEPFIIRTDTWIDIDCGCVFQGGRLACLCLDTMAEIYV